MSPPDAHNKGGRPAYKPDEQTRNLVEALAAYGVPQNDIADVLEIDGKTLRKHFEQELKTGSIKATAQVAESLFKKATGEGPQCVTAAIFWLKTRAGWKESAGPTTINFNNTVVNEDRRTIVVQVKDDLAELFEQTHGQIEAPDDQKRLN